MKIPHHYRGSGRSGFTLVELLVVIGIIALLVGILLPALSKARKQSQAVQCMSNMRQLGQGFQMYVNEYKGFLPWTGNSDGSSAAGPIGPWDDPAYWANAVPKEVGSHTYFELLTLGTIPGQATNNLFVCPSSDACASQAAADIVNSDGTFTLYGNTPGTAPVYASGSTAATATLNPDPRHVYWSYVINSKLDNSLPALMGLVNPIPGSPATYFIKLSNMKPSSEVPLLVEEGKNPSEISPTMPANTSLARGKTTWTRMATRHNKGGNLLFCDGHVDWFATADLCPPTTNGKVPTGSTNPAWNVAGKVTWDPFQQPLYGP